MDIPTKATGGQLTATEFNQIPDELEQVITDASITKSSADLTQISKSIANYSTSGFFYVDSGAADAYVLSASGSYKGATALVDGMKIGFLVGNTNTGASTVNVNGLGVKSIKYTSGRDLNVNDLLVNDYVVIQYDNSNGYFILIENRFTRINGSGTRELPNDKLLTAEYLKNTTNAYVHHLNETTWSNGGQAIGSETLTEVGTIGTGTNHLGDTGVRGNFDGTTNAAYFNSATFDTSDESFFTSVVIKPDRAAGTGEYLIAKYDGSNTNDSFELRRSSSGNIIFSVFYDAAGNKVSVSTNTDIDYLITDGKQHRIWCMYDQSSTSMMFGIDEIILGYTVNANLATRNNSSGTKLTIGAYDDVTLGNPFDGQMSDFVYHRTNYTGDDARRIVASGASAIGKKGTESLFSDDVYINGKKPASYYVLPTASYTITGSFANVTGHSIYSCELGYWKIDAEGEIFVYDNSAVNQNGRVQLYNGTSVIPGTNRRFALDATSANSTNVTSSYSISKKECIDKDINITLQAIGSLQGTITYASGFATPFIHLEKDM